MSDEFKPIKIELSNQELPPPTIALQPWPPVLGPRQMEREVQQLMSWTQNSIEQLRNVAGCLTQYNSRCEMLNDYTQRLIEVGQTLNYPPDLREVTHWCAANMSWVLRTATRQVQTALDEATMTIALLPHQLAQAEEEMIICHYNVEE